MTLNKEQTEVIILGNREVKIYSSRWYQESYFESSKTIGHIQIWEGLLDNPPLQEGDYIYIDELKQEAQINKVVRSTSNKYVYYVDYRVGELIENEETQISLEKALVQIETEKTERIKRKEEKRQAELENKKSKFRKILDIIKS